MKTKPLFTLTAAALIVAGMTSPLHAEPQGFFELVDLPCPGRFAEGELAGFQVGQQGNHLVRRYGIAGHPADPGDVHPDALAAQVQQQRLRHRQRRELFGEEALAVGAVRGHRIIDIGHRHQAGGQRYAFRRQPVRIT